MINNDKLLFLFAQVKEHDSEAAFSNLFDYCFPDLMRFAFSFVHSRNIAEEIASDVLLMLWKKKKELQFSGDMKLYLYVCARNKSFNHLRKNQNSRLISLEDTAVWSKATDAPSPEDTLITTELHLKIKAAIRQLPAKCQLIFKLIKEDGLKYKEAATLLELSPKTIEAQMGIAMKRIYNVFQNYMQEPLSKKKLSKTEK